MGLWFGRKAAVEPVRPVVPDWLSAVGSEGFARGYQAQFDEVYRNNPVGQRSVRLLSGLLGSLSVYAAEGDDKAAALVAADGLIESIGAAILLHGNAYVQLLVGAEDQPAELILLRPERVSVIADERGWPTAYLYRAAGQAVRIAGADGLGRRQVAHIKSLHPRDDHYGMGCLDAAIAAASVHNRASRWNKGLLDNAARPSGALTYEPADGALLSSEQYSRLKSELESEFSGSTELAAFSPAGWRFIAPTEGLLAWVKSTSIFAAHRSGAWELGVVRAAQLSIGGQQVVGARSAVIADATGGSTIDVQARAAIAAMLAAMRQHGLIATA